MIIHNRNEPYLPLPSQPQLVLIYRPWRDGRLSWPGWLVTYWDSLPARRQSPIPTTNRAQCRATAIIKTNTLPLHKTANSLNSHVCLSLCLCVLLDHAQTKGQTPAQTHINSATGPPEDGHGHIRNFRNSKDLLNPHPSAQQGHTTSRRAGTAHLRLLTGGRKGCPVRSAENNHSENGGVIGLIHSSLVTFHYQHFSMPV